MNLKKINFNVKTMKKKYIWIAAILVIALILARSAGSIKRALFKEKKPAEMEVVGEMTPVKAYKIKRMDFKDTLPVLGNIKGYKEIKLRFQVSGILESFNFEEGERVQEGDIIANLDQKDALLKLKYAELEVNKTKKMFELGAITQDGMEKARLEYESAKSDLEKTNIYAVSDGVLGNQDIDVGAYVTPNDEIGKFADITRVYGEFNIIEKDVPKLKLGQKCEVFVDAVPNKNFVGTIDTISPLIEGRTRTQRVRVELKNPDGVLKPGMFTRGLISTYEKKDAFIIPASSLKKTEEGYVVFIVHRDEPAAAGEKEAEKEERKAKVKSQKAKKEAEKEPEIQAAKDTGVVEVRPIKISYMTQDMVEVEKGVEEGELIVVELYQELQDKEKVEIAEMQEMLY